MFARHLLSRIVLSIAAICLITACSSTVAPNTAGSGSEARDEEVSIGVFVDNAFGDRAFFDIAQEGIKLVESEYDVAVNTYEGRLDPDNISQLMVEAGRNNDLVYVLGFEAIDAMLAQAAAQPDTLFVFIDAPIEDENVASLAYKDEEGCFVAGALAALVTTEEEMENINPDPVIGFVGGVDAPVIRSCESGYRQGAAYVDPSVEVETVFVGSFGDPAKGKEANLALVELGSDVNYQYAGLSGEGGFDAAREGASLYVIGAGFDQRFLAPEKTIGSMLKRVDLSIEFLTGAYLEGELQRGDQFYWGLAQDGVPFTLSVDLLAADIVEQVKQIEDEIRTGEISLKE